MNLYNFEHKPNFEKLKEDNLEYKSTLLHFYNWASDTYSVNDLKKWVLFYLQSKNKEFEYLNNIPEYKFSLIGKIAYLLNNNYFVSDHSLDNFNKKLNELKNETKSIIKEDHVKYKKYPYTLLDKVKDTLEDLVATQKLTQENMSELLFNQNLTYSDYQEIISYFKLCLNEWVSNDHDLVEMQDLVKDEKKKEIINSYKLIIKFCELSLDNLKASKLTKKKRIKYSEQKAFKKASKVENKKIDLNHNLVSLPADQIVGSNMAIIFNTKNNRTYTFYPKENETLSIRGKSIVNYDEEKSFGKVLRNTTKDLAMIKSATSIKRIEVILAQTLKGVKHKAKSIINSDTLILKVFK